MTRVANLAQPDTCEEGLAVTPAPTDRVLARVRSTIVVVGGVMLMVMMGLTVADVIGRYVFNSPVLGAAELTELLLAATIFLGLPLVSLGQDHVTVDLFTDKLPRWTKPYRLALTGLFSGVVLAVVAWRLWINADQIASYAGSTNSLRIPVAPLGYFTSVCAGIGAAVSAIVPLPGLFKGPKD